MVNATGYSNGYCIVFAPVELPRKTFKILQDSRNILKTSRAESNVQEYRKILKIKMNYVGRAQVDFRRPRFFQKKTTDSFKTSSRYLKDYAQSVRNLKRILKNPSISKIHVASGRFYRFDIRSETTRANKLLQAQSRFLGNPCKKNAFGIS